MQNSKDRNDITGDKIRTGIPSQSYQDNWEKIWGNKQEEERDEESICNSSDVSP